MATDPLVAAVLAADDAHNDLVARGASDAELLVSYRACLQAQLALCEDNGEVEAVAALREHIRRHT